MSRFSPAPGDVIAVRGFVQFGADESGILAIETDDGSNIEADDSVIAPWVDAETLAAMERVIRTGRLFAEAYASRAMPGMPPLRVNPEIVGNFTAALAALTKLQEGK